MRASLPATLLLSLLLTACSGTIPPSKHIEQTGTFKVNPGLLGQPVPAELRAEPLALVTPAPTATQPATPAPADARAERSIYFDFNSADIKEQFTPVLQAHARYLAEHPQARLRIEGNADERGPSNFNQQLGMKRADAVRAGLVANGASGKQLSARSMGDTRPKVTGHDEASWAENRRTDLIYERQ